METSTLTEALRQREASEVRAAGLGPAGGYLALNGVREGGLDAAGMLGRRSLKGVAH